MLKIKIKKKPKQILCIIIIILFCCFFYLILKNKNYQITYYINSVEITEKFDSKNQVYQFIFKIGDRNYISNFKNKYLYQKKLIKSIEEKSINNNNSIIPKSKKINL